MSLSGSIRGLRAKNLVRRKPISKKDAVPLLNENRWSDSQRSVGYAPSDGISHSSFHELQEIRSDETHDIPSQEIHLDAIHRSSSYGLQEIKSGIKLVIIPPDETRMVKRELTGLQLFMITLNGTLGTGLYWSGGRILEVGGPLGAFSAMCVIALFTWSVMQCITVLLSIWPVPGALSVYVSTFVDEELGLAVGVAYWFTYSAAFSALLAAAASEVGTWTSEAGVTGGVMYFALPLICIGINWCKIEIYGRIETIVGYCKIAMYVAVVFTILLIINGVGPQLALHNKYWSDSISVWRTDEYLSGGQWGRTFLTCLSLSSFAFVGVEIVAASALEARWDYHEPKASDIAGRRWSRQMPAQIPLVSKAISRAAQYFSIVVGGFYALGIFLVSFAIRSDHCSLERMSWITSYNCSLDNETMVTNIEWAQMFNSTSASPFVLAAHKSQIHGLDNVINAFILFTALFCASTTLYVASRTIFALTGDMSVGPGNNLIIARLLAKLGKTDKRGVPRRAILFSAFAFWWVPLLQIGGKSVSATSGSAKFNEVLTGMASVGVLIVWACNILAFIRFYHSTLHFQDYEELKKFPEARRGSDERPFNGHMQPYLAYLALLFSAFLILAAGGPSVVYPKFQLVPFLSTYFSLFCFIALWLGLKWVRGARREFWVDLSKPQHLAERLQKLHDTRYRGIGKATRVNRSWWSFGN